MYPTHFMNLRIPSGVSITRGFVLGHFDHSPERPFSVWFPSAQNPLNLKILDADGAVLLRKELPQTEDSLKRSEGNGLARIADGRWRLAPSNQGRRIVIVVHNGTRRIAGNDSGGTPLVIDSVSGDLLEVHFLDSGGVQFLSVE